MAEVYWDLEWTLQHQGFDYTYDKRLYDRLRDGHARPVREHFWAGLDYQDKLARFLENHDGARPRRRSQRESMQPRPSSPSCLRGCGSFTRGNFRGVRNASRPICVEARRTHRPAAGTVLRPAAGRAPSAGRAPRPVAIARMRPRLGRQLDLGLLHGLCLARPCGERLLVAVNYAPNQSQCYVRLPFADLGNNPWRLRMCSAMPRTIGRATICKHAVYIWICLPGRPPSSP